MVFGCAWSFSKIHPTFTGVATRTEGDVRTTARRKQLLLLPAVKRTSRPPLIDLRLFLFSTQAPTPKSLPICLSLPPSLPPRKRPFLFCLSLSPTSLASIPSPHLTHPFLPLAMAPHIFACFRRSTSFSAENTTADQSVEEQRKAGAVLVELFSSQGCAASPEAELLLSRLGRGDFQLESPVIPLAYHVDYWDHLGWKDPYGSSIWTVRQKAYVESLRLDTLYTPQFVIQGRLQCLGTDQEALLSAIASATRFPAPTFQASFQRPGEELLHVTITGALRTKVDSSGADVMVALYENGQMTDCDKGANKGRVLSNDYLVRRMDKLCSLKDVSAKKNVSGTVKFPLWEGFTSSKCGVVVFVQNRSLHAFGSQQFDLPKDL